MKKDKDYSDILGVEKYEIYYYIYLENEVDIVVSKKEWKEIIKNGESLKDWYTFNDKKNVSVLDVIVISDDYNYRLCKIRLLSREIFNKDIDDLSTKQIQLLQLNLNF